MKIKSRIQFLLEKQKKKKHTQRSENISFQLRKNLIASFVIVIINIIDKHCTFEGRKIMLHFMK